MDDKQEENIKRLIALDFFTVYDGSADVHFSTGMVMEVIKKSGKKWKNLTQKNNKE